MDEKRAILTEESAPHAYRKFTMTYSSGKTYTRYLSPENINQDQDLRGEMAAWAEDRGYVVEVR